MMAKKGRQGVTRRMPYWSDASEIAEKETTSGIRTYPIGLCTFLAGYFWRCASRSISMGLRTHFAGGSNFLKLEPYLVPATPG